MKKLFSFMLMATALLISGQVWAFTESLQPLQPKEVVLDLEQQTARVGARKVALDETLPFSVNGVGYNNLYEAFRNCSEEHPVKLEKDITTADYVLLIKHSNYTAQDNYLDLNGYNYVYTGNSYAFYFYNGAKVSLTITGKGTITAAKAEIAYMLGSTTDQGANWQVLNIGKDVTLSNGGGSYTYLISVYNNPAAYGVVINMNGSANCSNVFCSFSGNIQATSGNVPVLNIGATAKITCEVAIYGAGYGEYNIYGELICGDCGIYAKSGNYTIGGDAKIICTDTEYVEPTPQGSGFRGGDGCAIILDSKNGYAGEMHLTIKDNAYIKSGAGYAITEVKTDKDYSEVTGLVIESGTIDGLAGKGSLNTTAELKEKVVIQGTITGGIYTDDITPYVKNENSVISYVDMGDGEYRWTIGSIPQGKEWKSDFSEENSYVQLKHVVGTTTEVIGTKNIEYLAVLGLDTVIVKKGARLNVGEIVLNEDAVLVIEPTAMVVVTTKQGIISTSNNQLIIEASAGEYGQLLINPEVAFNTTPRATIEFTTVSYKNSDTDYFYERFALPTGFAVDSVKSDAYTYFEKWNPNKNEWTSIGYLNPQKQGQTALDETQMNTPFANYRMFTPIAGVKYKFFGKLQGTKDVNLTVKGHSWVGLGNSYAANMDVKTVLEALREVFQGDAKNLSLSYQKCIDPVNHLYQWSTVTLDEDDLEDKPIIRPMEVFLIKNDGPTVTLPISYENMIWNLINK